MQAPWQACMYNENTHIHNMDTCTHTHTHTHTHTQAGKVSPNLTAIPHPHPHHFPEVVLVVYRRQRVVCCLDQASVYQLLHSVTCMRTRSVDWRRLADRVWTENWHDMVFLASRTLLANSKNKLLCFMVACLAARDSLVWRASKYKVHRSGSSMLQPCD